jgi:TIR domain
VADDKKKIFISWSKFQSRRVAHVLKDYLPEILEGVEIFMSDKDIDPGQRSMKVLEHELDGTKYGIAVVTEANQAEPWLNFEAGALSKAVGNDMQGVPYVVPLLVDIPTTTQLTGPISQFQAVQLDHDGLAEIITSICKLANVNESIALKRFDRAWSEIDEALSKARKRPLRRDQTPTRPDSQKIDEVLEILRVMQRRTDVESLRPVVVSRDPRIVNLHRNLEDVAEYHGLELLGINKEGKGFIAYIRLPKGFTEVDARSFEKVAGKIGGSLTASLEFRYISDDLYSGAQNKDPHNAEGQAVTITPHSGESGGFLPSGPSHSAYTPCR